MSVVDQTPSLNPIQDTPGAIPATWVLYHADCLDGFGAAWAAWKALGASAQYQPVRHGEPPPDLPSGSRIYLLDFCYAPELLVAMAAQSEQVVILDHHISAQTAFERYRQTNPDLPGNLHVHFDLAHSGCLLAWRHFHPGQPVPPLLAHIEDRDLWRHALPGTREINRALYLRLPLAFEAVEGLSLETLEQEGAVLQRQLQQSVHGLFKQRHAMTVLGQSGLAVNAPGQFASDLGEALAIESGTFGLIYQFNGQRQRWECSLRSRGEFDVAALATQLGGGGHRNAAGFTLEASATPWWGVLELPGPDLSAERPPETLAAAAQEQEHPDSPAMEPAPTRLADTNTLLDQAIALTVEYQHRFDPYRGASKRAYLIAAERFGVTRQRVQDVHAGCQDWLASLTDDDLRDQLEVLQTAFGLGDE
jgi:hypothetical protein